MMLPAPLQWYLAPWRRVSRAPFNVVLGAATLPDLLFSLGTIGHVAGPLANMAGAAGSLRHMSSSPRALADALTHMQSAGEGFQSLSSTGGPDWPALLGITIMLALAPLFAARARDAGHAASTVRLLVLLALGGTLFGLLRLLGLPTMGLGFLAGLGSFAAIAYLCLKPSAATAPRGMTNPPNPATVPPDDPFRHNP